MHFVVLSVCLRSSDSQQEDKAVTFIMPFLCQGMLSISNQLIRKEILSHRKTGFHSRDSERLTVPSLDSLPPSSQPPALFGYPQSSHYPVLTEKDLPAKLDDLTTSVTLTLRHVWSVRGATVMGGGVGGLETGRTEMEGRHEWAFGEVGEFEIRGPKKTPPPHINLLPHPA